MRPCTIMPSSEDGGVSTSNHVMGRVGEIIELSFVIDNFCCSAFIAA